VHRVKSQKHQADEKEHGKAHHVIDHFALGNQVHEIAGHQKRLHAGNQQRDGNVDSRLPKGMNDAQTVSPVSRQQRKIDKQIPAHGMC